MTIEKITGKYEIIGRTNFDWPYDRYPPGQFLPGIQATLKIKYSINIDPLNDKQREDFKNILNSSLNKASSFQDNKVHDSVACNGNVTQVRLNSVQKEFVFDSLNGFKEMVAFYNFYSIPQELQRVLSCIPAAVKSVVKHCYSGNKQIINNPSNYQIIFFGFYEVKGHNKTWSAHNKGFTAELDLKHGFEFAITLDNIADNSKRLELFKRMLNSTEEKALAFDNQQLGDKLQFIGGASVVAGEIDQDFDVQTDYDFTDLQSFLIFTNYVNSIKLQHPKPRFQLS